MTNTIQIHEHPATPNTRPQLQAFLSLGFRPLYIAGCGWALLSIAIWIFAPRLIGQPLSGVAWHAHEMLWGFIATIAVGFLLTASATWTRITPLKGWPLGVVCLLWLCARIGYLAGGEQGFWIAAACELGFFVISAIALLRVVAQAKSRRNYGVPLLVLGLGLADALYLQAVLKGDHALLIQRFDLGLICMAVLALLIARRVIPFFAMRMVAGLKIPMLTRSGHIQLALSVLAIIMGLLHLLVAMAIALALAGLISLFQVARWQPMAVLHRPILWILYLGYALLGIGLLFAAVQYSGMGSGLLARTATHVHIIAMGGFSVLIIGMVTRTALGHLGRKLQLDHSMRVSYFFMIAAVALRLAALWPSSAGTGLLQAAATCWIIALGLYLWRFAPMLIRPRFQAASNAGATSAKTPVNTPSSAPAK